MLNHELLENYQKTKQKQSKIRYTVYKSVQAV